MISSQPLQWESPLSLGWDRAKYLSASSGKFACLESVEVGSLWMDFILIFLHCFLFPSGGFEPSHYNIISSFRTEIPKHRSVATLILSMCTEKERGDTLKRNTWIISIASDYGDHTFPRQNLKA